MKTANIYDWFLLVIALVSIPVFEGCSKSCVEIGHPNDPLLDLISTTFSQERTVTINQADLLRLVDKKDRGLWETCFAGDLKGVKAFERDHGELGRKMAAGSLSLLHIAVITGDTNFVSYLVSRGCDIQAKTADGMSVLHAAVAGGNLANIAFLIEKGVDVNTMAEAGTTPLYEACKNGRIDIAKMLVEKGADVNLASKDGYAPILQACRNGDLDMIRLLVKHGADINAGNLTLSIGVGTDNLEVVDFLIENGCNVNQTDESGGIPLGLAAGLGNTKIVRRLLVAGADIDRKGFSDHTALHEAVLCGKLETIQCLLDAGARITPEIIQAAPDDEIRSMLKMNKSEGVSGAVRVINPEAD